MGIKIKDAVKAKQLLTGGHRACAGCACTVALRQAALAASTAGYQPVVTFATGCMEVVTTIYPYSAWNCSYLHTAFENSAASCSGIETAYRALKKRGKIDSDKKVAFMAFGGDGGTFDIGFQALSGAMERRHNMVYICYNNEAYMNTGIQRSSATPRGAHTNTSPVGEVKKGKDQQSKDLVQIMVAHNIPYVAQASVHNYRDFMNKVVKAIETEGPAFITVLASCNRGWRIKMEDSISILKLAADSCFWPLFEVENGVYKINYKPKEKLPLLEYVKPQGRFGHLLKPENKGILDEFQAEVDRRWKRLQVMEQATKEL
ncbi:MAG: thiamine pyrophosphate-dependent enzyme [Planctomycetota bacterium]|jgi:pyruvate ferredoxin oxidoreductase beta subunit